MHDRITRLCTLFPGLCEDLQLAKVYVGTDPASSVVKARTVLETILLIAYRHFTSAELPIDRSAAGLLAQPDFTAALPYPIRDKMHAVRRSGNAGAHGEAVTQAVAAATLTNILDILDWTATWHSTQSGRPNNATRDTGNAQHVVVSQTAVRRRVVPNTISVKPSSHNPGAIIVAIFVILVIVAFVLATIDIRRPHGLLRTSAPEQQISVTQRPESHIARGSHRSALNEAKGKTALRIRCADGDPGRLSRLHLVSAEFNGSEIDPSTPLIVRAGGVIRGNVQLSLTSAFSNAAMALGMTPSWGDHAMSVVDLHGFSTPITDLRRSVDVELRVPDTPGEYYLIFAFRGEFNAQQVLSATNWTTPGGLVWGDADDVANWSRSMIMQANQDGCICASYRDETVRTAFYVPAAALVIKVLSPA